jgi:hypothetical protein
MMRLPDGFSPPGVRYIRNAALMMLYQHLGGPTPGAARRYPGSPIGVFAVGLLF